jgi:YbbR domain-containing protein
MQRLLTRDWGVKLGAVLLATALWFHAVTERTYRRNLQVPLIVEESSENVGDAPLMISSPVPPTVRVAVSGPGKDLLRAAGDDFLLRVQLPPGRPGRRLNLRLDGTQVERQVESNLTVDAVLLPTDLSVMLDHSEERRVPIRPRIGLRLAESYTQVGVSQLDADSVDITGPRGHVRQIEVIYTDSLFRTDVRADVDLDLALNIPQGRLIELRPDHVHLHVDIQELAEYEVLNVPVTVVDAPPGAAAEPSRVSVRVRGGADLIGNLDPESDIGLSVNYELARSDEGGLIEANPGQLYEIRRITPERATVVLR